MNHTSQFTNVCARRNDWYLYHYLMPKKHDLNQAVVNLCCCWWIALVIMEIIFVVSFSFNLHIVRKSPAGFSPPIKAPALFINC